MLKREWRARVSAAEALSDPWLQCDRTPVCWGSDGADDSDSDVVMVEGEGAGAEAGTFPVEWTQCYEEYVPPK